MKFIKFVTYLFYRYYSNGSTKDVAYLKTLCSLAFLLYINIWILLIAFGKTDWIPATNENNKTMKYVTMGIVFAPLILFFSIFLKERDLKTAKYDEIKVKRGSWLLLIYFILSIVVLFTWMFVSAPPRAR